MTMLTTRKPLTAVNRRAEPRTHEGCLLCGGELIYSQQSAPAQCQICGQIHQTAVQCRNQHFICDTCHAGDILQNVGALLINSSETDPVALAQQVFELPRLNMHGPEYHSIVPAVLVTAYQNQCGQRSLPDIFEAIRRGRSTPGGSCGTIGSCGAGIGAGIAVSILEKATPLTPQPRSRANRATAEALLAISRHEGARCCKRDAITTIRTFIETTPYFQSTEFSAYSCRQFKNNKTCLGSSCPYLTTRKELNKNE